MKLIVGLGNAGAKYAGTRHNLGFGVVDVLASRWNVSLDVEKFHACFARGEIRGEPVAFVKPTTLMNRSGRSVLAVGRFYKLEVEHILVVSDDMALPLGRLRMRLGGSAGGHKGLQDIVDRLGTEAWCRLRIGIGGPVGDPSVFVLTRFHNAEEEVVERAMRLGADAVECWVGNGPELTMTRFNGDPLLES